MRRCREYGYTRAWKLANGHFKCRLCGQRYTWKTAWAASRLPAANKRKLVEYFVLSEPSYRSRFRGLASLPTIEYFFLLIRAVLAYEEQCREPFDGAVECDETMFGGRRAGKCGWSSAGKLIVLGILKRNGQVRVLPVQGSSGAEIVALVCEHTRPGSLYYTDDWHTCASLAVREDHIVCPQVGWSSQGADAYQRYRRILELCETLALSVPWCASQIFPPLSG